MSSQTTTSSTPRLSGEMGQKTELSQRLMMSAHMQQALHLLQLPCQELETFIEEQITLNPLLEIDSQENDKEGEAEIPDTPKEEEEISISDQDLTILNHLEEDLRDHFAQSETMPVKRSSEEEQLKSYIEQSVPTPISLQERLLEQAHDSFATPREMEIAEILVGYIDPLGFLNTPLNEICTLHHFSLEEVQEVLKEIQTFDPLGVGAASIQESLLIQLRGQHKTKTLAYQIVQNHYQELLLNHIPQIQKQLKCSYEEIQSAMEHDIAKLDLHPGTHFAHLPNRDIIPDVSLREENDKLIVEVERDYAPNLRLNSQYFKMLNNPDVPRETKTYLKQHLFSARWLVRNLQQRYSTIERIAQALAEKQKSFFLEPDGKLVPLTMQTLATELNLHESTIARTVANKYINSPRGIFPLRSFFTAKYVSEQGEDLSAATIKQAVADCIANEDKCKPLSDEKISLLLKEKGMVCARRTVAKYRTILQIGNTQQRRKFT